MKKLVAQMINCMEAGEDLVLVTIVASSGSTPRGAGSRMLVKTDGSTVGTIGGGAVEYRATGIAREALRRKESLIQGFSLTKNEVADIGMICGGDVTVYFQYVPAYDPEFVNLCRQMEECLQRNQDSWLILDITDVNCWQMGVYGSDGRQSGMKVPEPLIAQLDRSKASQIETAGRIYYTEPLVQAGLVYIFGGGHVAQELVPVLTHVGFRCVVVDDRPEFACRERFPGAYEIVVGNLQDVSACVDVQSQDYVCIMTRGHQYDYLIQRQMLDRKPRYIGIMGSRRKIASVTEKLLADGYLLEEIERCHMPIGTEIGAVTPAEIAISIAGELILERTRRKKEDTYGIWNRTD